MPLHADLYLDRIDVDRYTGGPMCDICHVDSREAFVERLREGRICEGVCPHWPADRVAAFRMALEAGETLPTVPSLDVPRPTDVGAIALNAPGQDAPLLVTSNSQLTHEVLLAVLATVTTPVWLLTVDTGGNTVDMSMVYGTLTAERVATALTTTREPTGPIPREWCGPAILPGLARSIAEPLAGRIEHRVQVGPICAAELPLYLLGNA